MDKQTKKNIGFTILTLAVLLVVSAVLAVGGLMLSLRTLHIGAYVETLAATSVGVFVLFAVLYVYLRYIVNSGEVDSLPFNKLLSIVYFTVAAGIILSCLAAGFLNSFAMPLACVALTVGILIKIRTGLMSTIIAAFASLMIVCAANNAAEGVTILPEMIFGCIAAAVSGFAMIFLIRRRYSRFKLTWGAVIVALIMSPFSALLSLIYSTDVSVVLQNALYSGVGNLISIAIMTASLPLYERIANVWTDFSLEELISLRQPLLKRLSEEAPGTLSHCMAVANLAESCAIAIGVNPFMARACAYYHDVGKLKNPQFFVENQTDGYNPHDDLIPEVSASMITRHTKAGAEMLKEMHMPEEIVKAALEHHGDGAVGYFFMKAKYITGERAKGVDEKEYRYDGPIPSTKYSALIMLCDIFEAMFRAKPPTDYEEMEEKVDKVINDKILEGQLNDCRLTMKDLHTIKDTICRILPFTMHKRIDYAKAKERR